MQATWRVTLAADRASHAIYADTLADLADSVADYGPDVNGGWRIEALFGDEPDRDEIAARLAPIAAALGQPTPALAVDSLPLTDWLAENRRSFPPLRAGRFYIYGAHVSAPPPAGSLPIRLDAGMAFGSGEHATTRGCLLALDSLAKRGRVRRALDLGTGSGILAIAIAKAWRAPVLASDIDAAAVRIALENAARNGVGRHLRTCVSDGFAALPRAARYDLIVANILARPLMRLAPAIGRHLAPGGVAVLSGILAGQEAGVIAACRAQGLRLAGRCRIGDWPTLIVRRAVDRRRKRPPGSGRAFRIGPAREAR